MTENPRRRTAVVIGAGPAGLTAALELLERTDVTPLVLEASDAMGGISRTVSYKGNRIDIGGHRFFSKSDEVMDWWCRILPIEHTADSHEITLAYHGARRVLDGTDPTSERADPDQTDTVMLVRQRMSRIFYDGKFFNYPISLEWQTVRNLGLPRMARMGVSYLSARIRPRDEENLEDFYINRFGKELYSTFFEDYTEKVWGVPCSEIAADWGAQRVKGLSIRKAVAHAMTKRLRRGPAGDLAQKDVETSLIEHFLYPKFGPGQMWETVAEMVTQRGGEVRTGAVVTGLNIADGEVKTVEVLDTASGERSLVPADVVISTMPVKELVEAIHGLDLPDHVRELAKDLPYRDFITVGLLLRRLTITNTTDRPTPNGVVPDNWIYIQEPDVKVGRLQIFNNWSPYMVADPDTVWVGLEYFTNEGDELWELPDEAMAAFGIEELSRIGIIDPADVLDSTVIRVKKTYPAYFGSFAEFDSIRKWVDQVDNLFLVGRNGQHRYNNQDHSMLTAIEAVKNIASGRLDKSNVWDVNVELDYHESK